MAPSSGGPTRLLASLIPSQAALGIRVEICTTDRDNPSSKKLERSTLLGFLGPVVDTHVFAAEVPSILFSWNMRRWLMDHIGDYDLVHIHGLYRFPPTYAAWLARRRGVPYMIRPHGNLDPFLYRQSSRSVWLKRRWEHWFDLPNLHLASAIHYTSEEERDRAAFLKLRAPSFVIPNGLDWARFAKLPQWGGFRDRLGVGHVPLILFLGRINFKKGLDLLIPAFARVRKELPQAILAIVGPDNEGYGAKVRGWVAERGIQEAVCFVDHLDGDAVLEAYVDADVFVLPSYTENFGMAVAESMACGTPVVISDQVNIHRDVREAGAGLVTRCDPGEIAQALSVLLADQSRRRIMGEAGRKLVQKKWTWDVIVRQLMSEYDTILARHTPAEGGK